MNKREFRNFYIIESYIISIIYLLSILFDLTQIKFTGPFGILNKYKNNPVLIVSLEVVTVISIFQNITSLQYFLYILMN